MTRHLSFAVLLTCILLLVGGAAMLEQQRVEFARRAEERKTTEAAIASLRVTVNALAAGYQTTDRTVARLFTDMGRVEQAIRVHTDREFYRFGVLVAALGAGR